MAFKCGAACDLDKVRSLLKLEPAILEKFEQACMLSYLEDNRSVRICPSAPWCGSAIQVGATEGLRVEVRECHPGGCH
jgi:ariadne-1